MDSPTSSNLWLDLLADALAKRIAAKLQTQLTPAPRYYSAENSPLGSRRAFLDAARRQEFPSFRCGKRVLARRTDVDAWIEARPNEAPAPDRTRDLELLLRAGLRPIGAARGGQR